MEFFSLATPANALNQFMAQWRVPAMPIERIAVADAMGRVIALGVRAPFDVPAFARSTVDGYAVKAQDSFGASETAQALFALVGDIPMGSAPSFSIRTGECARIATGAMLPGGADAVVMVEYTQELGTTITVEKDVAPGENVVARGEDLVEGDELLPAGHILVSQDAGGLAALGISDVAVYRRPRVLIISTGNEIVAPGREPGPAQVRDINGPALMAAVASCGCEPVWGGIVRDEEAELSRALSGNGAGERPVDAVVLSGGSSVGPHDLAPSIINRSFSPGVVLHGLAIKPGKPTILALDGARPVFGLPGHPASALVVFEILVRPLLRVLTGQVGVLMEPRPVVRAILERNLASSPGREDYIRVSLIDKGGVVYARPILGKSGLISTLVKADGMLRIPLEKGGIEAGETVEVTLFRS